MRNVRLDMGREAHAGRADRVEPTRTEQTEDIAKLEQRQIQAYEGYASKTRGPGPYRSAEQSQLYGTGS